MSAKNAENEKQYGLDDPRNVKKIVYALFVACALLLGADFFYHKHVHFEFEHWFGFFGWFGFLGGVGLVLVARLMRIVLMRKEDYYDRSD